MSDDLRDLQERIAAVTSRAEFVGLLKELRSRRHLTVKELAAAVDRSARSGDEELLAVSYRTVAGWYAGESLPQRAYHRAFEVTLERLGVTDTRSWLDALARVRAVGSLGGEPPYVGLRPYQPAEAPVFFGRSDDLEHAMHRFAQVTRGDGPRLLVIVGASGSGKSSLIQAGLLPRLTEAGWRTLEVDPGADALATLTAVDPTERTVVVLDHAERLFSMDPRARAAVLGRLAEVTSADASAVAVLGLRGDVFDLAASEDLLRRGLDRGQVVVGPMTADQLRETIVGPARHVGAHVEEALVDLLLRDSVSLRAVEPRSDSGALPMLSHALRQTWLTGVRGSMTVADYHRTGGVREAIERSAEEAYEALDDDDRDALRRVVLRLVDVAPDARVTRRTAELGELEDLVGVPVGRVLDPFVARRLLTVHEHTVEISHEAMLTAWSRCRDWVHGAAAVLQRHRRLREATAAWEEAGRPDAALVRGSVLAELEQLVDGEPAGLLTEGERRFVGHSVEAERTATHQQRRMVRRLQVLLSAALVLALVAGVLAVTAIRARRDADRTRDEATSRQIAATARSLAATEPALAAQLAVAAYAVRPTVEARSALLDLAAGALPARLTGPAGTTASTISRSGSLLAVSDPSDGSVRLLTPDGPGWQPRRRVEPGGEEVYALALDPDGGLLAVGDAGGTISLWDVADPSRPRRTTAAFSGPDGAVQHLAISPDGAELAAVGDGGDVHRWSIADPATPRVRPVIPVPSEVTWSVTYAPQGDRLAIGDDDGRAWISSRTGRTLARTVVGAGRVGAVAFAPDGTRLATGTDSGELRVWRLGARSGMAEVVEASEKFSSWVNVVGFSPDGRHLLGGSSDHTLRVWRTDTWAAVTQLPHPAAIDAATFAEDGTLVTSAEDGGARVWRTGSIPRAFLGRVFTVGYSAAGDRLAVLSGEDVHVWPVAAATGTVPAGEEPLATLPGDPDSAGIGAFSPDGDLLARGTLSGEMRLYDVTSPHRPRRLTLPQGVQGGVVRGAVFNPGSDALAASGDEQRLRLWDLRGEPRLASDVPVPGSGVVEDVVWSPSGATLAAASSDGHVYLVDVTDLSRPTVSADLGEIDSESFAVAFDATGTRLATGGTDAVVRLWDVGDPSAPTRERAALRGPQSRIWKLRFAGQQLVAAVTDGTVWRWDVSDGEESEELSVLGPVPGSLFGLDVHPSRPVVVASGAGAEGFAELHQWRTDVEAAIDSVCSRVGDPVSEREWSAHLRSVPFASPCRSGARDRR